MTDDLARLVIGLPVAALFPWGIPGLRGHRFRGVALSAAYAAVVLAPVFPDWEGWVLLISTAAIALAAGLLAAREAQQGLLPSEPPGGLRAGTLNSIGLVGLAAFCALVAALVAGAGDAVDAVDGALMDDAIWVVVSGLLAAVFVAGLFLVAILGPFTAQLASEKNANQSRGLARAGTYIGWFERSLFFGFIVAGEPQAAAIALAAKSVARFPTLQKHEEGFAEYFLIGSLASLTFATAIAVGTRAALGLPAL